MQNESENSELDFQKMWAAKMSGTKRTFGSLLSTGASIKRDDDLQSVSFVSSAAIDNCCGGSDRCDGG